MIRVRSMEVLRRNPHAADADRIVIDLAGSTDRKEILRRITEKLNTISGQRIDGSSLDAFVDVVSVWMRESLPKPPPVWILNAEEASKYEQQFLAKIVACMHQATMIAFSQRLKLDNKVNLSEEIHAFRIDFYFENLVDLGVHMQ